MDKCWSCFLGKIEYEKAFELQQKLVELRLNKTIDDIVLVLEHPPTITLGKFAKKENIIATGVELEKAGVEVCHSNRGGDVTFHCPGQLIIYPIMDLRARGGNLRRFLSDLEEVVLDTLAFYNINAERWSSHPGIWVKGEQIAAIGLHFKRGVSMHGISLNVNPDLSTFNVINLCGLAGKKATSILELTQHETSIEEVAEKIMACFSEVLKVSLDPISKEQVLGDVLGQETTELV